MEQLVLIPVTMQELMAQLRTAIREELKAEMAATKPDDEKLISGLEARMLFSPVMSARSLKYYTGKGKLKAYKWMGQRNWYKKSEVLAAAKSLRK